MTISITNTTQTNAGAQTEAALEPRLTPINAPNAPFISPLLTKHGSVAAITAQGFSADCDDLEDPDCF